VNARAAELHDLAHALRTHAAGEPGRVMRRAANELEAVARALDAGGACAEGFAVVPLLDADPQPAPFPPPPLGSGRDAEA
jgi:hypothetical protein